MAQNMRSLFIFFKSWVLAVITVLWLISVTLANHSGLALIVDMKTGEKYCIDTLARYLNVSQENGFTGLLGTASVFLSMLLPVLAIIVLAIMTCRKRK
jgi:hypothetical protein